MSAPTTDAAPARLGPRPNVGIEAPYATPNPPTPIDLWLAGNEGRPPSDFAVEAPGTTLGRYPSTRALEREAARLHGLPEDSVLVTAGADDALLRIALAFLGPGRELVLPVPSFEMIPRYARVAGGDVVEVPWTAGEPYPTEKVLSSVTERTSVIAIVSPNNPTGAVASPADVRAIARAAPDALVVVDLAYGEFADEDLGPGALAEPNVVVLRTMSKAYGCAGLRVGFALGNERLLRALRAAGNPYPCASPSLSAARERLSASIAPLVERVRSEREQLTRLLCGLGLRAHGSQGNFVYAETERPGELRSLVAGAGIAIRAFEKRGDIPGAVRITCPGDGPEFERLCLALRAALAPDTLLFDMDGVLADVSGSYRAAIRGTAATFGVQVTDRHIDAAKAVGGANDDWELTHRLVTAAGASAELAEVTQRFEDLYQGTGGAPGLRSTETLLLGRASLAGLSERFKLAIVTGRPRLDAERFLGEQGLRGLFSAVIAREDAALKPSPDPTRAALRAVGGTAAWLLGDTPDDVRSARGAGVLPIGVIPPGGDDARRASTRDALLRSGAGVCLDATEQILEVLP